MSNDKQQPKPTAPKVDKAALEQSIKSHETAKSQNQTVKK